MPVEDKIDKIFDKLDDMVKCQSSIEKSIVEIETNYKHTADTLVEHDKMLKGDPAKQGAGGVIYTLTMVKKDVALMATGISMFIAAIVTFLIDLFRHKTPGG